MSTDYLARNPLQNLFRPIAAFPAQRARRPRNTLPSDAQIFERITNSEYLLRVYRDLRQTGGQAPGLDGIRFSDLSITEAACALRVVAAAIRSGQYRPHATRAVQIPKANGGTRVLQIGAILDRVVGAGLHELLLLKGDAQLLPSVYGFRPGRSVMQLLARLEQVMREQERYVIVIDDVREAFPSVRICNAVDSFRQLIDHPQLLRLVEVLLRGAHGAMRMTGIEQGAALSPLTLNLCLTACLDRPFSAGPGNPPWLRWADDLTYVCHSAFEGHQAAQTAAALLAAAGFGLKGTDATPTNLRRHGARKQILGYAVSWKDGGLQLQIPEANYS